MAYWKCFRFLATLVVCATQLGNYAVEITQMTLESAWIYEIHHFLLKFVSIYRKEVKIIALTNFLATSQQTFTYIFVTNRYIKIITHVTMWCRASRSLILAKTQPDSSIFSYYFVQKMVRVLTIYRLVLVQIYCDTLVSKSWQSNLHEGTDFVALLLRVNGTILTEPIILNNSFVPSLRLVVALLIQLIVGLLVWLIIEL